MRAFCVLLVSLLPLAVITSHAKEFQDERPQMAEVKIIFDITPSETGHFRLGDSVPPSARHPAHDLDNSHQLGSFAELAASKVKDVRVTWVARSAFASNDQVKGLLCDLLKRPDTKLYRFHIWSFPDGQPDVVAAVDHKEGVQGKWFVWLKPTLYWAYQDGQGKWYWGALAPPKTSNSF